MTYYKTKSFLLYDPVITSLGIYLLKVLENVYPQKILHTNVCSSFINSCQILEASRCPLVNNC
jgi:hypothetical protein